MFHSARLKLTTWYLTVIMGLSVMFSIAIYHVLTREIERFERTNRFRIEHGSELRRMMIPLPVSHELLEETKQRIRFTLLIVNAGIFVLAGASGYMLAGRTLAPIQAMMEEQRRFVSDASHELRTPLTSLKSAFEVYLRDRSPTVQEAQRLARGSLVEVNKLQSLGESMLELAHYTQRKGPPMAQDVSLAQVASEAIREISPVAKRKHIGIKEHLRESHTRGNKESLTQLVGILLDNAVKYSPDHTTITVSVKKADGTAEVLVADQGVGISKKDLPHIFDRFYRADHARTKTGANGYGLGLSIAKKIIEWHHGTIRVKSEAGKGSTFIVELPRSA